MELADDDSDRLKTCPFCGGEAEIITLEGETEEPSLGAQCVQCTNSICGASSKLIYPLMDDVTPLLLETWNKRHELTRLRADLEHEQIANARAFSSMAEAIRNLRADLAASQAECERLRVVLAKARDTFARYAKQHWAKGTLESDEKARVNDTLVAEINAVLAAKKGGE